MVVAQLVKRLLPTPDVPSSNPVNIYIDRLPSVNWIEKDGKKEKGADNGSFEKTLFC